MILLHNCDYIHLLFISINLPSKTLTNSRILGALILALIPLPVTSFETFINSDINPKSNFKVNYHYTAISPKIRSITTTNPITANSMSRTPTRAKSHAAVISPQRGVHTLTIYQGKITHFCSQATSSLVYTAVTPLPQRVALTSTIYASPMPRTLELDCPHPLHAVYRQ